MDGSHIIPEHVDPSRVADVNIYALPNQAEDYHAAWRALQQASPDLIWTPQNEGHWIALRGEILAEVQSDHERFSNAVIVIPKSVGLLHKLIPTTIDPPEHGPYRTLLNAGLANSKVNSLEDVIRAQAIELIESFRAEGRCDFTAEYARIFPIRIFMALVGIPMQDADKIRLWAECMTRPNPPMPFEDARAAFFDYFTPILEQRRETPGDDLLSFIVSSKIGDKPLSVADSLSLATQIMIAGVDTVVNFLGFVMLLLARNPDVRRELAGKSGAELTNAVQELFRRFGVVNIARTVRHDMEFHGVSLKKGELVCVPTVVHGLDERINPNPMRVDLARKGGRHSAFGIGPHMCPGAGLARKEIAITIEEWLRRIPDFRIAAESDLTCSGGIVAQINRIVLEWEPKT